MLASAWDPQLPVCGRVAFLYFDVLHSCARLLSLLPIFPLSYLHSRGSLDYILYTNTSLVPTAVLELPSEADVMAHGAPGGEFMPNSTYSSDHLALLSEFQYVRSQ